MKNKEIDIVLGMQKRIYNFIHSKVKDKEVSEDILQEVLLKVISKINTLNDKEKIISWVFQITRNEINSYFRNKKFGVSAENTEELALEDENLTQEFSECIVPLINNLPEKYKEALLLIEIKGLSQKELTNKLGISYSAVKSRVQRARKLLKDSINNCCKLKVDKYGDIIEYKANNCKESCD